MKRRQHRNHNKPLKSVCGDVTVKGSLRQIIQKYFDLADEAQGETMKQNYLQHAEHYAREMK